jgi:hypothetical protein
MTYEKEIKRHLNTITVALLIVSIFTGIIGYCLYPITHHKTTHYFEMPEEVSQLTKGDTVTMVQVSDTTRMDIGACGKGQIYIIK